MHQMVNDKGLDLLEANTHPFIVNVWLEETAEESGRASWRGHITHVPSDRRQHLGDLDDIIALIVPYLEGMGVKLGFFWKARWRWKQVK